MTSSRLLWLVFVLGAALGVHEAYQARPSVELVSVALVMVLGSTLAREAAKR